MSRKKLLSKSAHLSPPRASVIAALGVGLTSVATSAWPSAQGSARKLSEDGNSKLARLDSRESSILDPSSVELEGWALDESLGLGSHAVGSDLSGLGSTGLPSAMGYDEVIFEESLYLSSGGSLEVDDIHRGSVVETVYGLPIADSGVETSPFPPVSDVATGISGWNPLVFASGPAAVGSDAVAGVASQGVASTSAVGSAAVTTAGAAGLIPIVTVGAALGVVASALSQEDVDRTPPSAAIVLDNSSLIKGQTAKVTITFSKEVQGLALEDFTAGNGDLSGLTKDALNPLKWTVVFTPKADTSSAANKIILKAGSYTDLFGNLGLGATSQDYSVQTMSSKGTVADGYIKDAIVFRDLDGDGKRDDDEPWVKTDLKGVFEGLGGVGGTIISLGGTDISTGRLFEGVLKAPDGAAVINPLTTLVSAAVGSLSGKSEVEKAALISAAEVKVAKVLGISFADGASLINTDPLAGVAAGGAGSQVALQMQLAAMKASNVLVALKSSFVASGVAGTVNAAETAGNLLGMVLGDLINNSTEKVNFSDADFVKTVANQVAVESAKQGLASNASIAALKALSASASLAIANVNGAIDKIDLSQGATGLVSAVATQLVLVDDGGFLDSLESELGALFAEFSVLGSDVDLEVLAEARSASFFSKYSELADISRIESEAISKRDNVKDLFGADSDDTTPPSVAISSDAASLKPGQAALVTFTLSEPSPDFSLSAVSVSGGLLSEFSRVDNSGTVFSAKFIPEKGVTSASIFIESYKFKDSAGNYNRESGINNKFVFSISLDPDVPPDIISPTALIEIDKPLLLKGDSATITITFSKEVKSDFKVLLPDSVEVISGFGSLKKLTVDGKVVFQSSATIIAKDRVVKGGNVVALSSFSDLEGIPGIPVTSKNFEVLSYLSMIGKASVSVDASLADFADGLIEKIDREISFSLEPESVRLDLGFGTKNLFDFLPESVKGLAPGVPVTSKEFVPFFPDGRGPDGPSHDIDVTLVVSEADDFLGGDAEGSVSLNSSLSFIDAMGIDHLELGGEIDNLTINRGFYGRFSPVLLEGQFPKVDFIRQPGASGSVSVVIDQDDVWFDAEFNSSASWGDPGDWDNTVSMNASLSDLGNLGVDSVVPDLGAGAYEMSGGSAPDIRLLGGFFGESGVDPFSDGTRLPVFDEDFFVTVEVDAADSAQDGVSDSTISLNASLKDLDDLGIDFVTRAHVPGIQGPHDLNVTSVGQDGLLSLEVLGGFGPPDESGLFDLGSLTDLQFGDSLEVSVFLPDLEGTVSLQSSLQDLQSLGIDHIVAGNSFQSLEINLDAKFEELLGMVSPENSPEGERFFVGFRDTSDSPDGSGVSLVFNRDSTTVIEDPDKLETGGRDVALFEAGIDVLKFDDGDYIFDDDQGAWLKQQ